MHVPCFRLSTYHTSSMPQCPVLLLHSHTDMCTHETSQGGVHMRKLALIGAGGKMGLRISKNLLGKPYAVSHVEVSAAGQEALRRELDVACTSVENALKDTEIIVLAVPDRLIGKILEDMLEQIPTRSLVVML